MTEMFGVPTTPPAGSTEHIRSPEITTLGGSNGQGARDAAKEEARGVAEEGVQGGKHVASVAVDQAKEVASEAGDQAQALWAQARSELLDQAASQKERVADQLHTLAHEFGSMAGGAEQKGLASGLADQASARVGNVADWVAERDPGSLVGELKSFARTKPGTFLAVAAGIGLLAGRMTRGVNAGPPAGDLDSTPPVQPGIATPGSPAGRHSVGSDPSPLHGLPDLSPTAPAVGVRGSYPDAVSEDRFASRTPGMAP